MRPATRALDGRIAHRRREVQAEAFALGRDFHGEAPSVFVERLRAAWRAWRRS